MYLWLLHVAVWQKLIQYCKAIILQLKIKNVAHECTALASPKNLLDLHIVRLHPRLQMYGRECVLLMFVIYFAMHPKYK